MQNKIVTLLYVWIAVACFAINSAQAAKVVVISEAKSNPVELNCSTAGPYVWKHDGKLIKDANSSTFQVNDSKSTGNYSCESELSGLITYEAINFTKPVIGHGEKSITVTEGDTAVSLTCISWSSTPVTFSWMMDNDTILNTTKNDGRKSVLTISEVFMSTRANYLCSVENAAGKGNTTILVRVHSRLAPLWPFLGIVAEVGLMAVLTLVFAKREKNKQKRNGRSAPLAQSNDTSQRGGPKEE